MSKWRLSRLAVALGGLVILVGIVMTGIFILVRVGMVDLNVFLNSGGKQLFLWMLFVIGLLDLLCGIILAYGRR